MAFTVNPNKYISTSNSPKTVTIAPSSANSSTSEIRKRLKISAPGYDDVYVTVVQKGAPESTS